MCPGRYYMYTKDASAWTNLDKHLQFVLLYVSSITTDIRGMRLHELSF